MSKEELEALLNSYGVMYTSSLADRLMKEFEKLNKIESLIKDCEKRVENEELYGSQHAITCIREACFVNICKVMKGENNG